jgi:hypothetical protein
MTDGQRAIYEAAINSGLSPNEAQTLAFPTRKRTNAIGETNTNGNYNMTGSSYVNNSNTNNYTYTKNGATTNQNLHYIWKNNTGLSFEASASMALNKTVTHTAVTDYNYFITGSTIIPANVSLFLTASWQDVQFVNNGISASIATGSIVKIGIPKSYFSEYIHENKDAQKLKIWANNITGSVGLEQFNAVSSSTTGDYVVLYASSSRATMGSVVTNGFTVSLGTTILNNKTQ